ncbi:hypothetical protein GTO91_13055 [Heliobacterium undosum]|uniref:Uncharacterized protein n=1 Tax=Heliomicrobium undosum TaxID=121734 RepID=A0A845L258_9FIRM|nr:hypothetical protein [Heliomicrobium undosum]MZP30642.1 hypothetical protein [Heliomicrobium undosum]
MLLNAIFELGAPQQTTQTTIREEGGEKLNGMFFDLLKSVDADWATAIHDQEGKPFAISTLRSLARQTPMFIPPDHPSSSPKEGTGQNEGRRWRFTIRSPDQRLSEVIDQSAAEWEGKVDRIGNARLVIRNI